MNSQNLVYPNGNENGVYGNPNNWSIPNNNTVFESQYNNHPRLIADLLEEIRRIGPAGNPKNTGPMSNEIAKYREIMKISQDKINTLMNDIYNISKTGGKRRNKKTRKTRSY